MHENIDKETRACMMMWSAVVSRALLDLCASPTKKDKTDFPSEKTQTALAFLLCDNPVFSWIMECMEIDAKRYQEQLRNIKDMQASSFPGLTPREFARMKLNVEWFLERQIKAPK